MLEQAIFLDQCHINCIIFRLLWIHQVASELLKPSSKFRYPSQSNVGETDDNIGSRYLLECLRRGARWLASMFDRGWNSAMVYGKGAWNQLHIYCLVCICYFIYSEIIVGINCLRRRWHRRRTEDSYHGDSDSGITRLSFSGKADYRSSRRTGLGS